MTEPIKRYRFYMEMQGCYCDIEEQECGEYVAYTDHLTALAEKGLKSQIELYEYFDWDKTRVLKEQKERIIDMLEIERTNYTDDVITKVINKIKDMDEEEK